MVHDMLLYHVTLFSFLIALCAASMIIIFLQGTLSFLCRTGIIKHCIPTFLPSSFLARTSISCFHSHLGMTFEAFNFPTEHYIGWLIAALNTKNRKGTLGLSFEFVECYTGGIE